MFAQKVKEARKNAGLSQAELASRLFISQQAYAKYEVGKASPNPEMLAKIAKELGVSVDYLTSDYLVENKAKSDYWLPIDAREVADAYARLQTVEEKNMIRAALCLKPIKAHSESVG